MLLQLDLPLPVETTSNFTMGGCMSFTRSERRFGTSYRHYKRMKNHSHHEVDLFRLVMEIEAIKHRAMMRADENRHHRLPQSRGGLSEPRNISFVPIVQHRLWHQMFGNMLPEEICARINAVWIPDNYSFVCIKKGGV